MPKASLEFSLPEENDEYKMTMKAGDYYSALWDLYQFLRADSKYGEAKHAEVYEKFWAILKEHDVEI